MTTIAQAEKALRKAALTYPEVREDHPWGESAFKVREKTFFFMSLWGDGVSLTVKLPHSFEFALEYPFAKPAGYGLGRTRWVVARFEAKDDIPLDVILAWMDESYRTVAPKRLVAQLPPT